MRTFAVAVVIVTLAACGNDDPPQLDAHAGMPAPEASDAAGDAGAATFTVNETREFDATPEELWRAWSEGSAVAQWWGPHGFTVPVAEMDFREEGTSLVCMQAPAEFGGGLYCNTWTYTLLQPHERIEFVVHFTDAEGNRVDPAEIEEMPAGIPAAVPHEVTFRALGNGRTAMTIVEHGYTTREAVETSKAGLDQVLEKLDAYLRGG